MNTIFLLTTALIVSIDSLICGFSLSVKARKTWIVLLGICFSVFTLCMLTSILGILLEDVFSENIANLGGLILIAIGIYNLCPKKDKKNNQNSSTLKQSIIAGFGVGLDGAFANLSLSLMGYNSIVVPLVITGMHVALISVGIFLSKSFTRLTFGKLSFIPPLVLIALGLYKLIMIFV